jgi:aspartyl-tRNA(Asn)/glutamyl-tRNA(Gln) amidotransferase subunit C
MQKILICGFHKDSKMSIQQKDIEHIARLARLNVGQDGQIIGQLAKILDYMRQLNQLDTSNIPPTFNVLEQGARLRADAVQPGLSVEQALQNAPAHDQRSFVVPKII